MWGTWGGWGGPDYEDVMAGVDHVVARYPVDAKRLGVTGYSYGGFLTNWVITQTPRFAAAIVGAGISNWVSDYGTADIPRTKESEFGGTPWEAKGAETLLKWSPVMHAGKVVTPTLFVHGEADLRVPIEQGEQMYTALRKQKVPAKFIRYPGQLSRRLDAVEHSAPLPAGAAVVAGAPAGAGADRTRAALNADDLRDAGRHFRAASRRS